MQRTSLPVVSWRKKTASVCGRETSCDTCNQRARDGQSRTTIASSEPRARRATTPTHIVHLARHLRSLPVGRLQDAGLDGGRQGIALTGLIHHYLGFELIEGNVAHIVNAWRWKKRTVAP